MKKILFFFILITGFGFSQESQTLERINSFITIGDYSSALDEAKAELQKNSKASGRLRLKYIECLALNDDEISSVKELKKLQDEGYELQSFDTIENISWAILKKAASSQQYMTRLTSLIGAHVTHDVRAISIIKKHMQDSNAIIRSVAIQFASSYFDKPLIDAMNSLFEREKLWMVRLEIIKAIGKMKLEGKRVFLEEVLDSKIATFEEKQAAVDALISLSEDVSLEQIKSLASSPKAGFRKFACSLASYFDILEAKDVIIKLASDPITDVRIAALNTIALSYNDIDEKQLKKLFNDSIKDSNPIVAITAAYCALLKNFSFGESLLKKMIYSSDMENARYASSVLAKVPNKGLKLKRKF